ncbi:MAG: hypothetical protein RR824_06550, partial [Clostridia bacterium]
QWANPEAVQQKLPNEPMYHHCVYCYDYNSETDEAIFVIMYNPIQQLVSQDGAIYGAPFFCYVGYYTYRPDAWEAAGLTTRDVPTFFGENLENCVTFKEEECSEARPKQIGSEALSPSSLFVLRVTDANIPIMKSRYLAF